MAEKDIDPLCSAFPSPEFYLSREAIADAVRQRFQFNIIHTHSTSKVDVFLTNRTGWEANQIARRRKEGLLPDRQAYIASPEDVILGKMKYYREGGSEKHLRDMGGILRISGDEIDRPYLQSWITRLGYEDIWAAVQNKLEGPTPPTRA